MCACVVVVSLWVPGWFWDMILMRAAEATSGLAVLWAGFRSFVPGGSFLASGGACALG